MDDMQRLPRNRESAPGPGTRVEHVHLEQPVVRSYSVRRVLLERAASPNGCSRRHSMYAESAARDAAIRSMTWFGTPQIAHQVRMSSSLGACLADSMRLVLASCQPAALTASRPHSPRQGEARAAGRQAPAGHAERWKTARQPPLGGPVVGVRDRASSQTRLERLRARADRSAGSSVSSSSTILAVACEVPEADQPVIEHPVVVDGDAKVRPPSCRRAASGPPRLRRRSARPWCRART